MGFQPPCIRLKCRRTPEGLPAGFGRVGTHHSSLAARTPIELRPAALRLLSLSFGGVCGESLEDHPLVIRPREVVHARHWPAPWYDAQALLWICPSNLLVRAVCAHSDVPGSQAMTASQSAVPRNPNVCILIYVAGSALDISGVPLSRPLSRVSQRCFLRSLREQRSKSRGPKPRWTAAQNARLARIDKQETAIGGKSHVAQSRVKVLVRHPGLLRLATASNCGGLYVRRTSTRS